jgi:hypothetical protein
MTRRSPGATLALALWCAGLVLAFRLLLVLSGGGLAVPLTSPGDLPAWADATPPDAMAVALLRVGGLAACAYLLAVTVAGVLARTLHRRALAAAIDRVSPALVRHLVLRGSTAGLVVGALAGSVPLPRTDGPTPSAITTGAAAPAADGAARAPAGTSTMAGDREATERRATMSGPTDSPDVSVASATMTGTAAARKRGGPVLQLAPPPALPALDPGSWEVAPGDSLWSIAEDVVHGDVAGAGEQAVTAYWRRLVAANRGLLVDPHNPDLLVPGQRLELPPPGTG